MDEISISGSTMVGELKDGAIREYEIAPQDFGLPAHAIEAIRVEGVDQSKAMVLAALSNEPGAARDIVRAQRLPVGFGGITQGGGYKRGGGGLKKI
jgi:anthranilate phosphoribosyltransferase